MTYLRDGFEHLTDDETNVYAAIKRLNAARRTTNNSQIANSSGLPRTAVGQLTEGLRARGFIRNTGQGAAYHWRLTGQPVPYSVEARKRDRELDARAREMNEKIRAERELRELIRHDFCPWSEAKLPTREACAELGCGSCKTDLAERCCDNCTS
jgi:DNA-binding Lrp family transcriptional regulator